MNLFLIAFLLLLTPTIFQVVCGNLAIRKKTGLPFELVCAIAVLSQLISIFVAVELVFIDMNQYDRHCGIPAAAMFFLGIIMAIMLLLTIIGQLLWRQFRRGKSG